MRGLGGLLLALLLLASGASSLPAAEDPPRGIVEWDADPMDPYAGQPVRIRLRVLLEERFLRENLVPMSLRRLDVPVQVEAAWPAEGTGPAAPGTATLALGREVVAARRAPAETRGDRTYAVFEVERRFLPPAAGEVLLPAPVLRCAWASRFREDALGGRVAEDRHEGSVEGEALRLVVRPLPEEGRPADFGGAVGRFTVAASLADGGDGKFLRVLLRIEGEGNLGAFEAPRFPVAAGLHLLGVQDDGGEPVRTVAYDLRRGAGAAAVPPIRLPFFDPGEGGGWRTAESAALALPALPAGEGPADPDYRAGAKEDVATAEWMFWAGSLVLLLLVLLPVILLPYLLRRRQRAAEARLDPLAARAAAGALAMRALREDPGADPGATLVAFLAGRLGVLPAAVISPDLRRRLAAAGASPDLASRTADLVDRLVASRYGGPPVADAAGKVRALLAEWGGGEAGTFLNK